MSTLLVSDVQRLKNRWKNNSGLISEIVRTLKGTGKARNVLEIKTRIWTANELLTREGYPYLGEKTRILVSGKLITIPALDLRYASFINQSCRNIVLVGINLGNTQFQEVDLEEALIAYADLSHAVLNGAQLQKADLYHTNMVQANCSWASLEGARLRWANLTKVNFYGAKLNGADLTCAILKFANFSNAHLNKAELKWANLEKADLRLAKLQESNLACARLKDAVLYGAFLKDAKISGANLMGADLRLARLMSVDLSDAHLEGADLQDANLKGANLTNACLDGADLSGADLKGAIFSSASIGIQKKLNFKHSDDLSNEFPYQPEQKTREIEKSTTFSENVFIPRWKDHFFEDFQLFNWKELSKFHLQKAFYIKIKPHKKIRWKAFRKHLFNYWFYTNFAGVRIDDADTVMAPDLRRYVHDQQFLLRFKSRHPVIYTIWKLFSDCGGRLSVVLFWSLIFILLFAGLYSTLPWTAPGWLESHLPGFVFTSTAPINPNPVLENAENLPSFIKWIYVSFDIFSNLGIRLTYPNNTLGVFLMIAESFLGFMMLGMLISVLANRFARRS
jgi:uncharacterized protein YjbI with pentapeptide repeats